MTTDIKELVRRLAAGRTLLLRADGDRDLDCQSNITTDVSMALADELKSAIDALEAMAAERDRLKNALSKMTEFHHSTSEKVAIARKALGGDE